MYVYSDGTKSYSATKEKKSVLFKHYEKDIEFRVIVDR